MTERVAEEMGTFVGQDVGYSIRFDDCTDPSRTRIKVNIIILDPISYYDFLMEGPLNFNSS